MKILKQFGVIFGGLLGQSCDRTLSAVFFPGERDRYDFIVALSADRVLKD